MEYKTLFEKELNRKISEFEIYCDRDGFVLAKADKDLCFFQNGVCRTLGSNPYEPCLYILKDGNVTVTIHNSFEINAIEELAKHGSELTSITGNKYDLARVCELVACACNYGADCDIGYIEGLIAIEKMISLGAVSPETAVPLELLNVSAISDAFSHSKKLKRRVLYTEDNKAYVRIKK